MARTGRVEIRVTDAEKAAWAEAAGGSRKVSDWLRSLANREAFKPAPLGHPVYIEECKWCSGTLPLGHRSGCSSDALFDPEKVCNCNHATNTVVDGNEGHNPGCPAHPRNRQQDEPLLHEPVVEATKIALTAPPDAPTTSAAVRVKPTAEQCPRWPHHRKGTYCGTCKKIN